MSLYHPSLFHGVVGLFTQGGFQLRVELRLGCGGAVKGKEFEVYSFCSGQGKEMF